MQVVISRRREVEPARARQISLEKLLAASVCHIDFQGINGCDHCSLACLL